MASQIDESHIITAQKELNKRLKRRVIPVGAAVGRSSSDPSNDGLCPSRKEWWQDELAPSKASRKRKALGAGAVNLPQVKEQDPEDGPVIGNYRETLEPPVGAGYWDLATRQKNAAILNSFLNHAVIPPLGYHGDLKRLRGINGVSRLEKLEAEASRELRDSYRDQHDKGFDLPRKKQQDPDESTSGRPRRERNPSGQ